MFFVLTKGMSLIGPRPALPCEVAVYDGRAKRTLCVKPGCGGVWQVSSRSDSSFAEKVDMDLLKLGDAVKSTSQAQQPTL